MEVQNHLDFKKQSQLINVVLHKVSANPTGWTGGLVYNTTTNRVYYFNGTEWVDITDLTSLIGGGGITISGTGDERTITIDPDDLTVELSDATVTAKIRVKDKGITFSKIQDIPTMTVIGRVAGGSGVASGITILTDLDVVIADHDSLASAKSIKEYIEQVAGSLGAMQGGFSASTETTFPTPSNKGDYWYVTTAGTVQGIPLNIGDVLIANTDSASTTDPTGWTFLETNRDQATTTTLGVVELATDAEAQDMTSTTRVVTPSNLAAIKASDAQTQAGTEEKRFITPKGLASRTSTEIRTGIIEIATQSEVNTGTDDTRAVTPLKLKTLLDANTAANIFAATIGNGVATSIVVTHSLGTLSVTTEVYKTSTGETVIVDVARTTVNTVTVTFSAAPASDEFTIIVRK